MKNERKFLLCSPAVIIGTGKHLKQVYFHVSATGKHARVRVVDGALGFLAIKRDSQNSLEFDGIEVEIDLDTALAIIETNKQTFIEKTRYDYFYQGSAFIIDVYHEHNEGLIIVRTSADSTMELPDFLGKEITGARKYETENLSAKPFKLWENKE